MQPMQLPLAFSSQGLAYGRSQTVLAGDLGGTKTNLALFKVEGNQIQAIKEARYPSQEFNSLEPIIIDFLKGLPPPDAACLGVAGPVLDGKVELTNLGWEIDGNALAAGTGLAEISLLNDLEATAFGLAMLEFKDTMLIHRGSAAANGNIAVIAPGTGLGEAGLLWNGEFYQPFATEGGHCDYAPRTRLDFELYEHLQAKFGHVSWERLVCGPGIHNIYLFLKDKNKLTEPGWLAESFAAGDPAAVITNNIEKSEVCKQTVQLFIRYLAFESANLILKMKATGGLFIGGGIAPRLVHLFEKYRFNDSLIGSGRMNQLLEQVPVRIILNSKTALLGAAFYALHHSQVAAKD
jgi:glucokinase